jgi:hypothetical protein
VPCATATPAEAMITSEGITGMIVSTKISNRMPK